MSLLNKEHIADLIFRKLGANPIDFVRFDIHDEYYIYTVAIGDIKPMIEFHEGYIEIYIFRYNDSSNAYTILDTICKISETQSGEYSDTLEVMYSAGDFMLEKGDLLKDACADLAIESQVASGSIHSKFIDWS